MIIAIDIHIDSDGACSRNKFVVHFLRDAMKRGDGLDWYLMIARINKKSAKRVETFR